jgi:hypothetical protein
MAILGKLVYNVYYKPVSTVRNMLQRGLLKTYHEQKGRKEMFRASYTLEEIKYPEADTFEVYFLSGKKYWYQTAFCLYTLQKHANLNIKAFIVDDGSFDNQLEEQVKRQFRSSKVIRKEQLADLLDKYLPETEYPAIRKRRLDYPHLRKLTDIHILPGSDWKLVLDSDMLFFNRPKELLQWLKKPKKMLFMEDVKESYGYPIPFLRELTGTKLFPAKLNVGITGIASSLINWQELEYWTRSTLEKHGSSYLQEQGLTAMLAAKNGFQLLPRKKYKVLPEIKTEEVAETLHHYVAESKYEYFVKGWKKAL